MRVGSVRNWHPDKLLMLVGMLSPQLLLMELKLKHVLTVQLLLMLLLLRQMQALLEHLGLMQWTKRRNFSEATEHRNLRPTLRNLSCKP